MILQKSRQKGNNTTKIPTAMKEHLEQVSQVSLEHVNIHYHSSLPAKMNAYAFSQGEDIYIGPGHHRYLQHELIHYLQKKTMPIPSTFHREGIHYNTSSTLERAADQGKIPRYQGVLYHPSSILQPKLLGGEFARGDAYQEPNTAKELIMGQLSLQSISPDEVQEIVNGIHGNDEQSFTTAGFEYEFMQMANKKNPIGKAIHLEIGSSDERMGFTDLPFYLETDAQQAIELVCPPFLIATPKLYSIPLLKDITLANDLMERGLRDVIESTSSEEIDERIIPNIRKLVVKMKEHLGITMRIKDVQVGQQNFPLARKRVNESAVNGSDILKVELKKSMKGKVKSDEHTGKISPQLNFAIDSLSYLKTRTSPRNAREGKDHTLFSNLEDSKKLNLYVRSNSYFNRFMKTMKTMNSVKITPQLEGFFGELADRLAQIIIIPLLKTDERIRWPKTIISEDRHMLSVVKDMSDVWLKDSLENLTRGGFQESEIKQIITVCSESKHEFMENERMFLDLFIRNMVNEFASKKVPFMCHSYAMSGVRQDTYIDMAKQTKLPKALEGKRGHIVEVRNHDVVSTLTKMHEDMMAMVNSKKNLQQKKWPVLRNHLYSAIDTRLTIPEVKKKK